jgi:hypothetical protein
MYCMKNLEYHSANLSFAEDNGSYGVLEVIEQIIQSKKNQRGKKINCLCVCLCVCVNEIPMFVILHTYAI